MSVATSGIRGDFMGVDVSLEGMDDLIDDLELNVANATAVEADALKEASQPIIDEAKQTTAFKDHSHKLRDSLKVGNVKTQKGTKYVLSGVMSGDVYYGRMVEYGTSKADAHPFLAPAFEHHQLEAEEIIRQKLAEALK